MAARTHKLKHTRALVRSQLGMLGRSGGHPLLIALLLLLVLVALSAGRGDERPPVQVFVFGGEAVECTRLVPATGAHRAAHARQRSSRAPLTAHTHAHTPPPRAARSTAADAALAHPNHDMVTHLDKPRGFVERVQALASFPEGAVAHQHLLHFCFPSDLCGPFPAEGEPAFVHTFSLTNEDGSRNHCCCLTTLQAERFGLHGLLEGKTAARPLSIVIFSKWPLFAIHEAFLRQLWVTRNAHRWDTAAGSPLHAALGGYVRALEARAESADRVCANGLLVPHEAQLPAALRALRWQHEALAALLVGALTNQKMLVVSSDCALPPALIGTVVALLFPLEYPGVVVPLLPRSLHPDPATLINDNVAPFLIGVDAELAGEIAPYADDLLVVDLDTGVVRWPSPDPFEAWLRAPAAERLVASLRAHADSDDDLSAAGLRAGALKFVLDVVDLDDGALANSAHPADRTCAAQWRLAGRLIEDLLAAAHEVPRAGGELDASDVARQAQLCRAAYVRELCASEPLGARSGRDSNLPLLRDAYGSTACTEFLSVPVGERARLPEPQWLHWRRLGGQFECAVHEHVAGSRLALARLAAGLRADGVALAPAPVAAHADDWPTPAPFAPSSVEVISNFCDSFDAPAVGELVASAPCVLLDAHAAGGIGGTPAALAGGAAELGGTLISGRLYVTETHLCFQSAGELAPCKDVLALAQVAELAASELEGGLTVRTTSGIELRLLAVHRVGALHALVAALIDARANLGAEAEVAPRPGGYGFAPSAFARPPYVPAGRLEAPGGPYAGYGGTGYR
ncbi:hypothetical protein T492DRAFT_993355 [Pavlovales sp. CCMP2436]|nr:hypothetical protein T492DRAFT_993355 [Pavlovales sp. CCMP2436]